MNELPIGCHGRAPWPTCSFFETQSIRIHRPHRNRLGRGRGCDRGRGHHLELWATRRVSVDACYFLAAKQQGEYRIGREQNAISVRGGDVSTGPTPFRR
jgi:hypothetical protein